MHGADGKALVVSKFEDIDARKKIVPFSGKIARFLGRVDFQDNWILLSD